MEADVTKIAAFPANPAIKRAAAEWIVRIDRGTLTPAEKKKLNKWLRQNPEHREILLAIAKLWGEMEVINILAELFPLPETSLRRGEVYPDNKTNKRKNYPKFFAAAMISLLIIAGFLLAVNSLQSITGLNRNVYATNIGEQKDVELVDGTRVSLNTHSHVRVDYTDTERIIHMDYGEVYFEVAKNPHYPFLVYAGSGVIKAHGTAFNVRVENDNRVDVILTEGVVEVIANIKNYDRDLQTTKSKPIEQKIDSTILNDAGESVIFDKETTQVSQIPREKLSSKLSWQTGKWLFKGETLAEVMFEVSRYTDQKIIFKDPSIKELQLAGYFELGELEPLLEAVETGLGIKVTRIGHKRIELSNASKINSK